MKPHMIVVKVGQRRTMLGYLFTSQNRNETYAPKSKIGKEYFYIEIERVINGGGGGGGCFTPETLILMASGETKPIKNITIGDSVKSFDFQKNETTQSKVIALFKFQKTSHLIINGLEVTPTHPFCTGKGQWTKAGMLKVGDIILGEDLEKIRIESIEKVQKDVTVYNFTVDGTHIYFVSNGDKSFLVHNKGGGPGAS